MVIQKYITYIYILRFLNVKTSAMNHRRDVRFRRALRSSTLRRMTSAYIMPRSTLKHHSYLSPRIFVLPLSANVHTYGDKIIDTYTYFNFSTRTLFALTRRVGRPTKWTDKTGDPLRR